MLKHAVEEPVNTKHVLKYGTAARYGQKSKL